MAMLSCRCVQRSFVANIDTGGDRTVLGGRRTFFFRREGTTQEWVNVGLGGRLENLNSAVFAESLSPPTFNRTHPARAGQWFIRIHSQLNCP
jgi:hypothetical protein